MTAPSSQRTRVFDVAIIGAGPAGLAAVGVLRDFELDVVVIDEQPRAGGQILRQPPASFEVSGWLAAPLYDRARAALRSVDGCPDVQWRFGATVLGMQPVAAGTGCRIWLQDEGGCASIAARTVLLAPGCYEQPLALPGWTLPGVMGAGAIQAFVKSQQFVPGDRFVLAGSHPLQLVVADQLTAAGGKVAAVVFSQRFLRALGLLRYPRAVLGSLPQLAETARILGRLKRAGVPLLFGRALAAIHGEDAVVSASIARIARDGRLNREDAASIDCNRIGLCHGFRASSELARLAGVELQYRPDRGGWLALHDRWFQTCISGLFVAGEITGLAGAEASLEKGRIAAIGILGALQKLGGAAAKRLAAPARRRLAGIERFAGMLNRLSMPPPNLADESLADDTVVCRCEGVTYGALVSSLDQHPHIASADAAKLCTRAGMGMCQGRFCAEQVMHAIARHRGSGVADVGLFRTRFPVKPLNLGLLAKGPCDAANE